MVAPDERTTAFLAGDVMLGRGVDQVLEQSVDPGLHERWVKSAHRYVELAEAASGPVPAPVGPAYPWGDALEILDRVAPAARIVNLETALTAGGEPWPDKGIHYRAHPENAAVLRAGAIDACVLANNHAMDWGREGLVDTLDALEAAGMAVAGAGRDREAARAPAVVETAGARVLVFALGSPTAGVPEAWAAGDGRAGICLLPDLSEGTADGLVQRVRGHRAPGDRVVVSIHWGGNWGHRIPEEQRRFARRLVASEAVDLVHGHSSHHPRAVELCRGRPILYGCGDLINDYEGISGHEEHRPELVLLWLARLGPGGAEPRLRMVPMRTRRFRLERASREDARWLARTLDRESRPLGTRVERADGRLAARADR